ncbi:uncharacterized protein LOC113790721 [Dermatophagoides pteronyssinus]|uniref:uncharacterized protein LOC113790721 n=1 Tax=Dermatophagoides pteronyssinus TaxID=6956 RepID=UPI003F677CAC
MTLQQQPLLLIFLINIIHSIFPSKMVIIANNNDDPWSNIQSTTNKSMNLTKKFLLNSKHHHYYLINISNLDWKSQLNETIQSLINEIQNINQNLTLSVKIENFSISNKTKNDWPLDSNDNSKNWSDNSNNGCGLSNECTIIITIMASVCLLLLSALTLTLILWKKNKSYGLQNKFQQNRLQCRSLSVPNFHRYVPSNLRCPSCSSSLKPRKSSLKPPTDSFRIQNIGKPLATISRSNTDPNISDKRRHQPSFIETDRNIDINKFRRKSMVTFNEATLIQ